MKLSGKKALDTASDAELIRAYLKGDEKAFEVLYYRYRQVLYGYLNNLADRHHTEADEVFAETWLRVIDKLTGYRDNGKFSAWLFRVARNIFIDRIRRLHPEKFVPLDGEEGVEMAGITGFSPDRETGTGDIRNAIDMALNNLPPEQKEVFLLREEAELSFREIADIQQCSLGTVLSRMRYALKNLRAFLQNIDSGGLLE